MNQLGNLESETTMSSIEFLNDVINPARKDAGEPVIENRHFLARVVDEIDDLGNVNLLRNPSGGRPAQYYVLNMEQMTLIGMRESKSVRRKVLEKLKEMSQSREEFKLPGNYVEALEALLESEKQKAIMAPKAEVYDRIVDRGSLMNSTQVGQPLGLSAVKLNQHLSDLGVFNRSVKRGKAFQQWFIDKGYGEMKQTEMGYPQALFTTAGQAWITQELSLQGII